MRSLLCLLSDQHLPNLLSVHHFRPDRLILVESSAMKAKKAADHFLKALKLGNLDFTELAADGHSAALQPGDLGEQNRCYVVPLVAEDDLEEVRACLRRAHAVSPTGEWVVNLRNWAKITWTFGDDSTSKKAWTRQAF